jgi:ABC-type uncharacterized transport system involved in gliding motility auxiliary subunit
MSAKTLKKSAQRLNALLSVLLLVVIVTLINDTARKHVSFKRDLSEDQLYAASPELEKRLGELDDVLVVRAFFTASPEQGVVQIAKSQLVSQLRDYEESSRGRIRLDFVDPNSSSEAKLEAVRLGITPTQIAGNVASGGRGQEVWLGISLKYRGVERGIPLVMPQTLEYAFASELFRLMRGHTPKIGWFGPSQGLTPQQGDPTYVQARRVLQLAGELVDIETLSTQEGVPEGIDLLVVVRPDALHPRAAFAIDQYLQRGGRAILALDNHHYSLGEQDKPAVHRVTGLEMLLDIWGAPLSKGILWDRNCVTVTTRQPVPSSDGSVNDVLTQTEYTYWPTVDASGLAKDVPVTARLGGLVTYWTQAILQGTLPADVERADLAMSSDEAWVVNAPESVVFDPSLVRTQGIELSATSDPQSYAIAVALTGKLPSPFGFGKYPGAPGPLEFFDAVMGETLWDGTVTDELIVSGQEEAHVVLIGDADWLRDGVQGYYFDPSNYGPYSAAFLGNVVDWMLLEEDLVALRSRTPISRPLVDFLKEERDVRGLAGAANSVNYDEAEVRTKAEDDAEDAAASRRTWAMARATAGSLAAALLFVGLPGLLRARRKSEFEVLEEAALGKEKA